MGTVDLTVKVLDISPKATQEDITNFFSYCGTIDDINLQRDGNQPQLAFVTFKQPYAFQTALLLDGATVVDRRVRILPLENSTSVPIKSYSPENKKSKQSAAQVMTSKGHEVLLNKAKELDEKYKVSETSRTLTQQTKTAIISSAEQTAGHVGSVIISSTCFSKGALWLSGMLDKASKYAAELGNYSKSGDTNNTRKRK